MDTGKLTIQNGSLANSEGVYIEITRNGPYVLYGHPRLSLQAIATDSNGTSVAYREEKILATSENGKTYLCRCGQSRTAPFCDGSHLAAIKQGLNLDETAGFSPTLEDAVAVEGPLITLTDTEKLCAYARFCDAGQRIWNEAQGASKEHVEAAIDMAHKCPGGRLIVWDNQSMEAIESKNQKAEVVFIEDPAAQCSGPVALRGGIPVKSSSGEFYEVRNRQTLCRCGFSENKPFCNGAHAATQFHAHYQ